MKTFFGPLIMMFAVDECLQIIKAGVSTFDTSLLRCLAGDGHFVTYSI